MFDGPVDFGHSPAPNHHHGDDGGAVPAAGLRDQPAQLVKSCG